jgi:hypothetical protein
VTFQVSRPVFRPPTRPCVLSKRLRSTMNRKSTSPGSVASSQLQWAQFFITFSSPGCTHATGSRGYISDQYTHFLSIYTALRGSKRMRSAINRTSTSPDSVASPQLQCAQFFIVFSSLRCTHAAGSSGDISGQSTHFCPPTRPCVRSKRLRSATNRTSTSFDSVASPQL